MGLNTAALILNDGLGNIERDTELGQKISTAMREVGYRGNNGDVSAGGHYGAIKVLPPVHADYYQVVLIGGNTIQRLASVPSNDPERLLRDMADQLGFTLRRKSVPTVASAIKSASGMRVSS